MEARTPSRTPLIVCLCALTVWSVCLFLISPLFDYDIETAKPILIFVLLQMTAGVIYMLTLWLLRKQPNTRTWLWVILVVGLVMRLSQLFATPVLETDFYRYLWDGALTANGFNPYRYAPEEVHPGSEVVSEKILRLAERSEPLVERINHPHLRTIYPPTAQASFALAYKLDPFDIKGLRYTWFGVDVLIVIALMFLLKRTEVPIFGFAVYWLNPLLIKEVFNSGHMELLVVLFALVALVLAARHQAIIAAFALAFATGAKVWPVVWLPLMLRKLGRTPGSMIATLFMFVLIASAVAWPVATSNFDEYSGFTKYAKQWQMNDSAYLIVHEGAKLISDDHAHTIARIVVMGLVGVVIIAAMRCYKPNIDWLIHSALAVIAAVFLLSPTQFPWYYLWVLPLLAVRPMWSLIALTVTLPMYYLRFMFTDAHVAWFDYGLIWLQFVPIWVWLGWELRRMRTCTPTSASPC